ncbi:MAG: hypothetical protein ACR652_22860 [Methylocystis sp.]|uniref:hypothetical protein n=1 Tax=Methylocystis sp. TaxID=1911079 RepID=UPI003DA5F21E
MSLLTSRGVAVVREVPRAAAIFASPWTTLALLCLALAQQIAGHLDCDVSWFITFAEKVADGAVPYVDVTDPNPPAAFLALVPAVALARALGLAVEPVVAGLVFFAAGLSLGLCALIFRAGAPRSREEWRLLLNAAVFLLLVAPAFVFAEREHVALLALAPMLASLAVCAEGGRVAVPLRVLAGLGAGIAVCFKPFFILAIILPAAALALRERSIRLLLTPEAIIAGGLCALYGAATLVFFPAYAHYALPTILEVYQPAREGWVKLALLSAAPFNVALLLGLAVAAARGFAHPSAAPAFVAPAAARVCAFASAGFLAGFFIQGKGWTNHAYPGLALALLAWCFFLLHAHPRARAACDGGPFKFVFLPIFICLPALFGAANLISDGEEHPGLRAELARVAPAHPRLIAMARQLDFGHPVTRQLAGTWVGRPNALWTASFAAHLIREAPDEATRARLEAYRRRDLAGFAADVRAGAPDAIIVEDKGTREWVLKQAETAGVLEGFEKTGEAGEIELWTRKARVAASRPEASQRSFR